MIRSDKPDVIGDADLKGILGDHAKRPLGGAQRNSSGSKVVELRPGFRLARARPSADERAFLPALLEITETPVSPTRRWTALSICAFASAALLWACWARIDIVAVAEGKIIPLGQVKVIQSLQTAMIRAIRVDDGDHVKAGQLLVELDPTEAKADLDGLTYDMHQAALDAEVARLLLTRDPTAPFVTPGGVDPELAAANHDQAVNEIVKYTATVAASEADVREKRAEQDGNKAQILRASQVIPLLQSKYDTAKVLYDQRDGPKQPMLDAQQQLIEQRSDAAGAVERDKQLEAEARSLEAKLEQTRAGFLADAADRRTKALQRLSQATQALTKARQNQSYRELVAPVDGTVQNVKIHTPGAVVTSGDTLMTIVPDGTGIEIDARVLNQDIGFVHEGQDVAVKVEAFPFTRYGLLKGTVRKIGRDAVEASPTLGFSGAAGGGISGAATNGPVNGASPSSDLTYPSRVTLAQDWIGVDGRQEHLQPGMRVSVEIRTGDRRVIEFLMSPVLQLTKEAGRER